MRLEKTKRGAGSNCFCNYTLQRYYADPVQCLRCKRFNATEFHHNIPRAEKYADSILNACALCKDCHDNNGDLLNRDVQEAFIKQTVTHLAKSGYGFTDLDKKFIIEYGFLSVLNSLVDPNYQKDI